MTNHRLAKVGVADGIGGLTEHDAAALLAQVGRERDEARAQRDDWREAACSDSAALEAAERQLAEARAALEVCLAQMHRASDLLDFMPDDYGDAMNVARALLSGETTRVEDEP